MLSEPFRNRELSRTQPVPIAGAVQRGNMSEELSHFDDFSDDVFAPGHVLVERYRLEHVLGTGGMSIVYRAIDLRQNMLVAVKVLHTHLNFQTRSLKRFQLEGKALSKVNHKNIVRVHEFGMHANKTPFMVMEYVQGTSLAERLDLEKKLPLENVLEIALQVCDALEHAHSLNVIHRDLKPSNIMVEADENGNEHAKIVDFGIAKVVSETHSQMTATGEVFGSPLYMSPEQCGGLTIDQRTDLYSLGCIIYECLTGSPPIYGDSALATMLKHQQEQPESLSQATLGEIFPDELERIVAKLLAKSPDLRYERARELTLDLENVKLNGYAALPLPPVSRNSVAADMFKSLQVKSAEEAGLGAERTPREGGSHSFKTSSLVFICAGTLAFLLVGLIASMYFIPSTLKDMPTQSERAQFDESVNTEVATQLNLMNQKNKEEEEIRSAKENERWKQLVKIQPRNLKLSLDPELTNWTMLSKLSKLHALDLSGTSFGDNDIVYLKALPLRSLDFTGLTLGSGLKSLSKCPALLALNLSRTKIHNADLAGLNNGIRDLSLEDCEVSDDGIKNLLRLTKLRNLNLHNTQVTDKAIQVLAKMKLNSLNVQGTLISSKGISVLESRQPSCVIFGE